MREAQIKAFLTKAGWADADRHALAGDASARRYERLSIGNLRAVLMDAPPPDEDVSAFVKVTGFLRNLGLSAPQIHASDASNGFLLLEDLGDDLFAQVCNATPGEETRLYKNAVDLLGELHKTPAPPPINLPPYDDTVYHREAKLVCDWYLDNPSPAVRSAFTAALDAALAKLSDAPKVVVLRDYHAENLIDLPDRQGTARVGLLDYQDALIGHPAYDLVSLLEDARRDTSTTLQEAMIEHYLDLSGADPQSFRRDYAILGAQRNLKIIGIFGRLCVRDGKDRYLDMIPRVAAHLARDVSHPALGEMKTWINDHLPAPRDAVLAAIRRRR